ncbi:MAG: CDP-alcohol phosphatidyltransferase family protein [Candidatus Thiodiazotropha sp. (ex Semelilucina semeliformis)]|nr:CDP-alcohol phosphatidyltransferase family protein [Candidatus Thiodiazotropha sp. (ex Semelilucina semeliformis)]MCU7830868.1 CDP-alcohol phosphatidyltransferase family protein [Candidatus Thiodiazotropha sp. (ex Myrtea sp. 'scaly one' KF741663)]
MISIYQLKPRFQALLRPLCRWLAQRGVTANQVTIAAVVLSGLGGAWIAYAPHSSWPLFALPVILFIRMALNAIDGMLAREFAMQSRLGAVLNEMGDVVADACLYLPLAFHPDVSIWGMVGFVLLGTMVEMIGVVAVQIGGERRYDGPFGKSDRAFAMGLLALLLGIGIPAGAWINGFLLLAIILSVITLVNRGRNALSQLEPTS